MTVALDLNADPVDLTAALVDVPSVSGEEAALADAVQRALREQAPALELTRSGNTVLARTNLGRPTRVVLAGHLDTVPVDGNLPHHRTGSGDTELLHGRGTVDMKGGVAVMLHLAAAAGDADGRLLGREHIGETDGRLRGEEHVGGLQHDLTFVFYDCEEVEYSRNGLGRIERDLPDWLLGDLAVVCEPSNGVVEAGCQGTIRVELRSTGKRAHTARAWMGSNAIHAMGDAMRRLAEYQPRTVDIDGCTYREGLQAVHVAGGVAGNVVPDECVLTVNHRFAPDRGPDLAEAHLREVFAGYDLTVVDVSAGALPGLTTPAAKELVDASGGRPVAKLGWTDVARFAALGMPAVNFGPGDPTLSHTTEEHVPVEQIRRCAEVLRRFLG